MPSTDHDSKARSWQSIKDHNPEKMTQLFSLGWTAAMENGNLVSQAAFLVMQETSQFMLQMEKVFINLF